MASGVADSRKRSSLSCEVGKPDIADSLGGAALLSSAIADFIIKKGLPYSLSNDPLLERVIKAARTEHRRTSSPLNLKKLVGLIKDSRSEHPEGFELEAEDDSEEDDEEDDDDEDDEDDDEEDDEDEDEDDAE